MKRNLAALLIFLCSAGYIQAQQPRKATEAKTVEELEQIFQENFINRRQLVIEKAKELNIPLREELPNGVIRELVDISPTGLPIYIHTTNNLDAAKTIQTNKLWPSGGMGLSLTGQGMTNRMGVWDGGAVRLTHQEFQGRAVQTDGASTLSAHATHVAGTMCAGGVVANAKGMSYQAPIKCHDWSNDDAEMTSAAGAGLLVSNHSYSHITGWEYNSGLARWEFWGDQSISTVEDYQFGFYDGDCEDWDEIANSYPNYLIFVAAGNDRGAPGTIPSTFYVRNSSGTWIQGNSSNPPNKVGPYNCISGGPSNAKNVITIGAVNKIPSGWTSTGDVVMSSFSGWGPTDDGRIKPDVVANGVSVYSSVSTGNSDYDTYNGTSMATPNACGSALLIQQFYNQRKATFMRNSTLKGLIIHTADEAGTSAGPDYTFGWGLMNAAKAVATITDTLKSMILEKTLVNSTPYSFTFFTDGTIPLKASICWTDKPGPVLSPVLNPTTKMLVNDLDLRIKRNSDNQLFYPYKLNPATPTIAATTGDNNIDNVEQVYLGTPAAGTYTITVSHKNTLNGGSQTYALIVSGISPKPSAGFSVENRIVCMNKNLQFTDNSSGGSSRMWYFPGGVPSSTSVQNPVVSYPTPGMYPVAYRVSGANGYDSVYQADFIKVGGIGLPIDETFEPSSLTRALWTVEKPSSDSTWRYWTIVGTSPGNTAVGINNYDAPTGNFADRLVSPVLDLRGYTTASMTFQYAYTRYDNSASDSLVVSISTNCGNAWTRLVALGEDGSGNFATAPDNTFTSEDAFVPSKAGDWCGGGLGPACKTLNLDAYVGNPNVVVRFEQRSNYGANNMFLDNIKITGTLTPPVAGFFTLSPTVCTMTDVQLYDSSYNHPSEWHWYISDADTLTYSTRNPNVKFLTPGLKTIMLAVKNAVGSDSIAKVGYLNVLASPAKPVITSSKGSSVCNGDSTILSTSLSSNFIWFKNGSVFSSSLTSFAVKDEGTYFIKVDGGNGCSSTSDVLNILTGITPGKPTVTKNISGTTFCEGGTFNLVSSVDNGNQWFVNGVAKAGQAAKTFNYNDSGTFKVQVSDKGCFNYSDELRIDKLPRPNTSAISGATWAVKDDSAQFSVTAGMSGSTFTWQATGGTVQSGNGSDHATIKFGSSTSATVSVQENASNGCKSVLQSLSIKLVNTGLASHVPGMVMTIYPNPAHGLMNISLVLAQKENVSLTVYNIMGQEVMHVTYNLAKGSHDQQLDISGLNPGFYMLNLRAGDKNITRKFAKE